jgi:hypothetical protein
MLVATTGPCLAGDSRPFAFCPFCYSNAKRRGNFKGHHHYTRPGKKPYVPWRTAVKLPENEKPRKEGEWSCPDHSFKQDYPTLTQGMCDDLWSNGKPRIVWTFSVRMKEAGVLITVTDKGLNKSLYTEGEDLMSALALVEEALSQGTASWRKNNFK